jgi:sulfonate transport system substrate-binding protein
MDKSQSDDRKLAAPAESATGVDRRKFLGAAAATAGGLILGDLATSRQAQAQTGGQRFTDWGWPQPYEQISPKSKQWLEARDGGGQRQLDSRLVGRGLIGNILQTEKLLEKRGIRSWQTFVAAGFERGSYRDGSTREHRRARRWRCSQQGSTRAPSTPGITRCDGALDSPLKSLSDLGPEGAEAAGCGQHDGLDQPLRPSPRPPTSTQGQQDFTLRSMPPGDPPRVPRGWTCSRSGATPLDRSTEDDRLLETLNPYHRQLLLRTPRDRENTPDVVLPDRRSSRRCCGRRPIRRRRSIR